MNHALMIFIIFIGGSILTMARRWENSDEDAGGGIAAWTLILVILYILNIGA